MLSLSFRKSLLAVSLAAAGFLTPSLHAQGAAGPAHLQANRVADGANLAPRTQIAGHIPAWARTAADQGAVPDSERVQLIFSVARTPEIQAAFTQLAEDQQNVASPRYHQWLTPQQIGDQYGPTQHDLDALTSWLTSQGFTIDSVTPSKTFIQASATAATVANALQTSLHTYALKSGTARAPLTEPSLPSAFAGIVTYIDGLANVPRQSHAHTNGAVPVSALTNNGTAEKPAYTSTSGSHYLFPADFNVIYDVAAAASAGYTGAGQKVTIIGGSRLLPADVTNYEGISALPSYSPNTIVGSTFTDPGYSTSDQTEGMLDFERVYGTAPGAGIDLVIAQGWLNGTTTQNLLLYAINTVNDPVMSLSFGACENLQTPAYVQYENTMYQQAATQGMSVFVSSGDSGAAGCDGLTSASTAYDSINDICATGYVTCVGGTQFSDTTSPSTYWSSTNGNGYLSALSYIPEGAWNEPSYLNGNTTVYQAASSGGGFSTNITKPSFQVATGVPVDGQRDVPDISFSASNHTSYILCQSAAGTSGTQGYGYDCVHYIGLVGGTSAAAPSMAGIAAILDQKLGGRQGNLNTLLYKLYASSPSVFHDATPATSGVTSCTTGTPSTCNNSVPVGTTSLTPIVTGYPLTVGYDQVTGLGSLDVNAFLNAAVKTGATTTTLTATPTTITTAQTVKFTATIGAASTTPAITGSVQFYMNSAALGAAVPVASNAATTPALTFATAGTYTITAVYSGDTNYATSTSTALTFVVTAPPLPTTTTTLTVTPGTIVAQSGTVALAASVTSGTAGTPSGSVTFYRNVGGSTVQIGVGTVVAGKATASATNQPAGTFSITAVYSGDQNFSTSTSAGVPLVVTALPTTIAVTVSPTSGTTLTNFTATATVTPVTANTVAPTGTVTFYVDGVAKGSAAAVSGTTAVSAAFLLPISTGANDKITAIYSGDSFFGTSTTATAASPTVIAAPSFTISPASSNLSVASSTSGSVTDVLTPVTTNGFTGMITYGCSVSLTSGTASVNPGCAISPSTVTFPATATLTITTIAPHVVSGGGAVASNRILGTSSIAFAGLLLFLLPAARRRRTWRALSLVAFLAGTLFTLSGCGGGGVVTQPTGGTTTGSYIVTVTGTTTTGIPPATVNINLTVN